MKSTTFASEAALKTEDIKTIICDLFLGGDAGFPLEADTDLLREGICDSLALVQIATELEQKVPELKVFDAEITGENFGSIARIEAFLAGKQGQ